MTGLTKKIFLETNICQRKGWLLRNREEPVSLSVGEQFRIDQGIEIGKKARELFPAGILVREESNELAAAKTAALMADPLVTVIFEATFQYADYTAKSDILIRNNGAWELVEVKSKTEKITEKRKDLSDLLDDMAYTALLIARNGVTLSKISLMLLSESFRLGMSLPELFKSFDFTRQVNQRTGNFERMLEPVAETTTDPVEPAFGLTPQCKNCDFIDHCIPPCAEYTILNIPRLSERQLTNLTAQGIFLVQDVPSEFRLTATQQQPVACMRSGEILVNRAVLIQKLAEIHWPAHYLDFETTQTAFPLYPDATPYEKIPTQYSIHTCSQCGAIPEHKEYLADPLRDCRHELAESLIRDLEGDGSVLSYSTFENQIINGLIKTCPDLEVPLTNIAGRLVDLLECTKCVSHPEFRGSNSIKAVLPVLVPGMTYEGMPIANGDDALVTFAYMALGKFSPEECVQKREEMLRYCEQDTLAMVKIHEVFTRMAR